MPPHATLPQPPAVFPPPRAIQPHPVVTPPPRAIQAQPFIVPPPRAIQLQPVVVPLPRAKTQLQPDVVPPLPRAIQPQPVIVAPPRAVQPQAAVVPPPCAFQPQPSAVPPPRTINQPQPVVVPPPRANQPQPVVVPLPRALIQPQPVVPPPPRAIQPQPVVVPPPRANQPQPAIVPPLRAVQPQPGLMPLRALLPPQAPPPRRVPSPPRATSASGQPLCPSQRSPSIWLLHQQICQSRWNRQVDYGSNACTFIALLLARNISASNTLNFPPTSMTPGWLQAITQAIECGNTIHDRRHQGEAVNYSPREAGAALTDEYPMTLGEELPASLSSLVPQEMTLHYHLTVASRRSERQFAVFTSDTGMSYLIVVDSDNILLVDTHQHGEN